MNAQIVLKHGFKGKEVGNILKQSKSWTDLEIEQFTKDGTLPQKSGKSIKIIPGSVWDWLCNNPCLQNFPSREGNTIASNSEKRRWIESGSVIINGDRWSPDDKMPFLFSLVFFPKSRTVTML